MKTTALATLFALLLAATPALAGGGEPLPRPTRKGTPEAEAVETYNKGLQLSDAGDFLGAEKEYRRAIALDPQLPEAWNGLGHSLKRQKRYQDSLAAYDRALALRPEYPLAMQYLGELYVDMGRMDDARALLAKLRPLDQENADELAEAIFVGSAKW